MRLSQLLFELAEWVSIDARVVLRIHNEGNVFRLEQSVNHGWVVPSLLKAMGTDSSLPFARNGNLKVVYMLHTADHAHVYAEDELAAMDEGFIERLNPIPRPRADGSMSAFLDCGENLWALEPLELESRKDHSYIGFSPALRLRVATCQR